ncbi:MAG: zinc-ribbon domain-containing protein [Planctomycetota bacterium]|jgi:TM2 domain-containing membrane protein YozV
MNCPHCGAPLEDAGKFCGRCGSELSEPSKPEPPSYSAPRPQSYGPPPPSGPAPSKDPNTALLLELLPAFFGAIFGVGHIYNGHVARGLLIMFGTWVIAAINVCLMFIGIGFCTFFICHYGIMAYSAYWAYNDAKAIAELEAHSGGGA